MRDLLFLAHRIPYPPNKGDKIRSWHMLRHLARSYRVHLGCFVDDPADRLHEETLRHVCASLCLIDLNPRWARMRSARALLSGAPLTLPYYRDARLAAWVSTLAARERIERIVVFSAAMAQYAAPIAGAACKTIVDFVDADSQKWRDYALTKAWPASSIYRREARTLLAAERAIAARAQASIFVSQAEAGLFHRLAPEVAHKVGWVGNGVDCAYFTPQAAYENPYGAGGPVIVFTGAMDYWPNVEAVRFFADDVLPLLGAKRPDLRFAIVGARPHARVQALARHANVDVVGAVADMRPYLAHAALAVAPMNIARGVQNKVLEAMAMAKPTVVTPQALEGIDAVADHHVLLGRDAAGLAGAVERALMSGQGEKIGRAARQFVLKTHDWPERLRRLDELLEADQNCTTKNG